MRSKKIQPIIQGDNLGEDTRRKSTRVKTARRNDEIYSYPGRGDDQSYYDEDTYEPIQRRKRRKGSDDYNLKNGKKKNIDKIAGVLDWKREMELPSEPVPKIDPFQVKTVKNICECQLTDYGKGMEGIFINIKWSDQPNPKKNSGTSIEQFRKLKLENLNLLSNGMVFIWVDKHLIGQVISIMSSKGFNYAQNFQIVLLDLEKGKAELAKKSTSIPKDKSKSKSKEKQQEPKQKDTKTSKQKSKLQTSSLDTAITYTQQMQLADKQYFLANMDKLVDLQPNEIFLAHSSQHLKQTKIIMLLFRKVKPTNNKKSSEQQTLQLRHQRNADVIFDLVSPKTLSIDKKTKNYIYNMIQTLLPESVSFPLKLIWGDKDAPRKGWITISEK